MPKNILQVVSHIFAYHHMTYLLKRRTTFCVHLIERYLFLGFLTGVEEDSVSRLTYHHLDAVQY